MKEISHSPGMPRPLCRHSWDGFRSYSEGEHALLVMPKTAWITGAAGILLLAGLPIVGCWLRRSPQPCCALDGVRLEAVFRVRVQDHEGHSHEFCSVRCAELWLQRQPAPPRAIYVTDEATGQEIDAASAYYVRSQVVTAAPAAPARMASTPSDATN